MSKRFGVVRYFFKNVNYSQIFLLSIKRSFEICSLEFKVRQISCDVCSHGECRKLSLIRYQVKQMEKGKRS